MWRKRQSNCRVILCCFLLTSHPSDCLDEDESQLLQLKNRKNIRDGSVFPSKSVFQITVIAEDTFQQVVAENMKNKSSIPFDTNMYQQIVQKSLNVLNAQLDMSTIFLEITGPPSEMTKSEDEHKLYLLKAYLTRYLKMRCLSFSGVLNGRNRRSPSKRNKSRKTVHFTGE